MSMEGLGAMPAHNPDSQRHHESEEQADVAEMTAALTRTLQGAEWEAFMAATAPGLSYDERALRIKAFNDMHAGFADDAEPEEERAKEKVLVNFGGTNLLVSRDIQGIFTLEFPS